MNRPTLADIEARSARNKAAWRPPALERDLEAEKVADSLLRNRARASSQVREQSDIERALEWFIADANIPAAERNYRHIPGRKFELDFAWPALKLGVEVQGMAHRIKGKFEADVDKRALAQLEGWLILEVSGRRIRDGSAIEWLKELYDRRKGAMTLVEPALPKLPGCSTEATMK